MKGSKKFNFCQIHCISWGRKKGIWTATCHFALWCWMPISETEYSLYKGLWNMNNMERLGRGDCVTDNIIHFVTWWPNSPGLLLHDFECQSHYETECLLYKGLLNMDHVRDERRGRGDGVTDNIIHVIRRWSNLPLHNIRLDIMYIM